MRITNIDIQALEAWQQTGDDQGNAYLGIVTMKGKGGEMKIRLSQAGIMRVFGVIASESKATAKESAGEVGNAFEAAKSGVTLLENGS